MKNLPPFTVRESPQAKRVILKISARHGLEVVIPRGFSRTQVTQIIQAKREWIELAWRKIQEAGDLPDQPRQLPEAIYFEAVNLSFTVEYVSVSKPFPELVHRNHSSLQISGDRRDLQGCQNLLKRWLQHQGRLHLVPWLAQVSGEIGFNYRKVQIRSQKSRWGSYSSRGTISLNQNLLFLRPALVRYLLIHELCHTMHLNHSTSFYQLLAHFVPDYQRLRAEMQQARDRLPWWTL
jgi:predicted metal-dependent hydrolase